MIRVRKVKQKQYMFNLDKFIADSVTFRPVSMFAADIEVTRTCPLSLTLSLMLGRVRRHGRASVPDMRYTNRPEPHTFQGLGSVGERPAG